MIGVLLRPVVMLTCCVIFLSEALMVSYCTGGADGGYKVDQGETDEIHFAYAAFRCLVYIGFLIANIGYWQ
jgi:hypothetical protein